MKTLEQLYKLESVWSNCATKYEGSTSFFGKQQFKLAVDAMVVYQSAILDIEDCELDIATFGDGENFYNSQYDMSYFE